jgi:hypothetical protein
MRILRYLVVVAVVCGLSGVAKADDFQMVVVDPLPAASEITLIHSDHFTVTLSTCNADQLFGLSPSTWLGCFTGENVTGAPLTSLQVIIPVFSFGGGPQPVGCDKVSQDVFATVTCGLTGDGKDYLLNFSGGAIPTAIGTNGDCDNDRDGGTGLNNDDVTCNQASIFTIAEAGVPAGDFPKGFTVDANVVPEPSSIWLLFTGVLSIGLFGAYQRRQTLHEPGPYSQSRLD